MLPDSLDGRALYSEIRENRSRWRDWNLGRYKGSMEDLKREEFGQLALESELAGLKECSDFMRSEDMLTQNRLRRLIT